MKIGVIGAGAVGSACVLSTIMRGCAREIVVVNRDRKRAKGLVDNVRYGASLSTVADIRDGVYADLTGAVLVMIAAGENEKTGGATDRNDPSGKFGYSTRTSASIGTFCPTLQGRAASGDPRAHRSAGPLADIVRTYGFERVLSSGTFCRGKRLRRTRNLRGIRLVVGAGARSFGLWACSSRIRVARNSVIASSATSVTPTSR